MPVLFEHYTATVTFVKIDLYSTAVTYSSVYRTHPNQTQATVDMLTEWYKFIVDGAKSRLRVPDTLNPDQTDGDTTKDGVVPPGVWAVVVILIILLVGAAVAILILSLRMLQTKTRVGRY